MIVADLNVEGAQETIVLAKAVATNTDFQIEAIETDVGSEDSVKASVAQAIELFGRIDYAVHSAGVSRSRWAQYDPEQSFARELTTKIDTWRYF